MNVDRDLWTARTHTILGLIVCLAVATAVWFTTGRFLPTLGALYALLVVFGQGASAALALRRQRRDKELPFCATCGEEI